MSTRRPVLILPLLIISLLLLGCPPQDDGVSPVDGEFDEYTVELSWSHWTLSGEPRTRFDLGPELTGPDPAPTILEASLDGDTMDQYGTFRSAPEPPQHFLHAADGWFEPHSEHVLALTLDNGDFIEFPFTAPRPLITDLPDGYTLTSDDLWFPVTVEQWGSYSELRLDLDDGAFATTLELLGSGTGGVNLAALEDDTGVLTVTARPDPDDGLFHSGAEIGDRRYHLVIDHHQANLYQITYDPQP